jgi:hypothetical protein
MGGACSAHEGDQKYVNIKVKVVPVLILTEHHAMKTYWRSGGIAPRIL